MSKKYDLITLGELLIDFTISNKIKENANPETEIYSANPGGAPANVIACAQKLGLSTAFIGSVGADHFGDVLINSLKTIDIDTSLIQKTEEAFTTLAFVSLDQNGDREFSFARKPGADMFISLNEDSKIALSNTNFFHFGSISLITEQSREATKLAVKIAKENDAVISFDPNIRLDLWDSQKNLLDQVHWGFKNADIVKLSDDDLKYLTDILPENYIRDIFAHSEIKLILYTSGKEGSTAYYFDRITNSLRKVSRKNEFEINAIDTTGAGDIFTGAFLSSLNLEQYNKATSKENFQEWTINFKDLENHLDFANKFAGLSTLKHGGIPSIPSTEEFNEFYNV